MSESDNTSENTKAANPANSETNQSFKIDIDQIYNDFIKEIDANRSLINISGASNNKALDKFEVGTADTLTRSFKIENTPQESRFHCFMRLIGFPVVAADNTFYNPGFDNMTGQAGKEAKIKIANTPYKGFNEASLARENYTTDIRAVWAKRPANITASCMALSSGRYTRQFVAPLKNTNPFDFEKDTSYNIKYDSVVGSNSKISLKEYLDSAGTPPDGTKLPAKRNHFIKPLFVDPRIDFTCCPLTRRVAVPFGNNKSNLLADGLTYIKRPLLEKVIRERFSSDNSEKNISTAQANIKDIITKTPIIKDQELITKMTSDIKGLSDAAQFAKYINIISAMCKTLKEAKETIVAAQADYYWLPQPAIIGPEGGSAVAPIIISQFLQIGSQDQTKSLVTSNDADIIVATLNQAASKFTDQVSKLNGTPDLGKFAFDEFKLTFGEDTSTALGDQVTDNLDALNKARNKVLTDANNALRSIEIIMGEWGGLGLCDIVAIMASLYLMPKDNLLGFLDDEAMGRLVGLGLFLPPAKPGLEVSYISFLTKIQECYNLMDYAFDQRDKKNNQRI